MSRLACFKAYDIRGRLGINLDTEIAYRIGRAFLAEAAPLVQAVVDKARDLIARQLLCSKG